MIKGLLHAALSTRSMEASLRFYRDMLGGRLIVQVDEPAGRPLAELLQFEDGTCLELFHPREDAPFGADCGRNHLCFTVDDMAALEKKLEENGVAIDTRPRVARDGNLQMWCVDPNGYRVEFMQLDPNGPQMKKGPVVKLG